MYYTKYDALPLFRQKYIVKNFIKGIYLTFVAAFATRCVTDLVFFNIADNYAIHTTGLLYCLPDVIGLIRVPKLHRSTQFHHITVTILSLINLFTNYDYDSVWKGMVIYAYLSTLTGIVNHYLAYRLVYDDANDKTRIQLAAVSLYVYCGSLALNWTYQIFIVSRWTTIVLHHLCTSIHTLSIGSAISVPIYMVLLWFIIDDDIILAKYLYKEIYGNRPVSVVTTSQPMPMELEATPSTN
jgi:hypothetical protein